MEKITNEMREKLREPLPQEALTQHGSKTFLTSIKPMYVIERLNDVFGVGSWTLKPSVITTKGAMIVVQVDFKIPAYGIELSCFGGNDNGGENSKNHDLGDAYKGATTDALTKIASWLEIGIDIFKGKQNHKTPVKVSPKVTNIDSKLPSWVNDKFSQCNTLNALIDTNTKILESKPHFEKMKEYKALYSQHEERIDFIEADMK